MKRETQKLTIEGELPDLNEILADAKRHWGNYSSLKRKWTVLVAELAWTQLKPVKRYPVAICFEWYCANKRKDIDNVAAGKKFILDGLVAAGVLEGDGWRHVSELRDCFFVDKQKPRVEVILLQKKRRS